MENIQPKEKLWTRNFTILTLGTFVSMLGNSIAGFALGLLVLDYTENVLLFSIYMVVYSLPKLIMPLLGGTYLDRYSRAKTIYTLDFISAVLYFIIFIILKRDGFGYLIFLALVFIIGCIDSVYLVAYDSLYPLLITKGNSTKAYSIPSILGSISAVMVPVASWCYYSIGLEPLFLFNGITFLIAAICEVFIKVDESQILGKTEHYGIKNYYADFKEGIKYISGDKGLLAIALYFSAVNFASGADSSIALPYFKSAFPDGVKVYTYVFAFMVLGRLLGGMRRYKVKFKAEKRFAMAFAVYIITEFISGTFLFTPTFVMQGLLLAVGYLGVTSYNIRISSTQSYVPNELRGRFNGAFLMLTTLGYMSGTLISGALANVLPHRLIILVFHSISIITVFFTIYRKRKEVSTIYSIDV